MHDPRDKERPMKRTRPGTQTKIAGKKGRPHELVVPRQSRSITPREREVLQLVWGGFMNRDIGQRLKISVRTVEAHRSSMMLKMGVSNTAQLLRQAIQLGLLKTDPSHQKPPVS
jgi:DNA-binding NarL/FixJ family response regulator